MSIRRSIRKAIQTGTTMYAVVEESNLGLATVRLGGALGARMTNISTVGGVVSPGDAVVVDWSAGIDPIVRPLFVEEEEEIELGISVPETLIDDEDISTFQDTLYGYDEYQYLQQGVPKLWRNGRFDYDQGYYQEYWDSANIVKNSSIFGDEYMHVPRDGKYLMGFQWLEPLQAGMYEPGGAPAEAETQSHYRIRILKNDSIVMGIGTGQWSVGYYGETSINISAFEPLEVDDRISFEIYFTSKAVTNYWIDNWGFFDVEGRTRWLIYLPGT